MFAAKGSHTTFSDADASEQAKSLSVSGLHALHGAASAHGHSIGGSSLPHPGKSDTKPVRKASLLKLMETIQTRSTSKQDRRQALVEQAVTKPTKPKKAKKVVLEDVSSGVAPLVGKQAPPEPEESDDPRAVGFGTKAPSVLIQSPAEAGRKPGQPGFWKLMSLAGVGARTAMKNALPTWNMKSAPEVGRALVVEAAEVDHSDLSAPSAASLLSHP